MEPCFAARLFYLPNLQTFTLIDISHHFKISAHVNIFLYIVTKMLFQWLQWLENSEIFILSQYGMPVEYCRRKLMGLFYLHGLTIIPAWINDHVPSEVWDKITYLFPNLNAVTVEVWEWRRNFNPQFVMNVITYPCWDLNWSMHGSKRGICPAKKYVMLKVLLNSYHTKTHERILQTRRISHGDLLLDWI